MKRVYFLIFFLLISVFGFPQLTEGNQILQGINLASVFFTDGNKGFTVGNNGISLMTENGGVTWIDSPNTTASDLKSVFFTDVNTGYAVGNGVILKTTDSGHTWNIQSDNSSWNLTSVFFTDSLTGIAVGKESDLGDAIAVRTYDGGETWYLTYKNSFNGSYFRLFCVYFKDSENGWALGYIINAEGSLGALLSTTNGGEGWSSPDILGFNSLNSMCFPDPDTGYIVGGAGPTDNFTVYKTMDAGANWGSMHIEKYASLFSVFFTDVNHGIATSDSGHIYRTTDGGQTWSLYSTGVMAMLNSVYFTDKNTGYIVGNCGIILKTTDAGLDWTILANCGTVGITETSALKSVYTVYPNPAYDWLTISDTGNSLTDKTISIFNLTGQNLIQGRYRNQNPVELDVSSLSSGFYQVKIQTNEGTEFKKLIKK